MFLLLLSGGISIAVSLWIESNLNSTGVSPTLLTIVLVLFNAVFNFIVEEVLWFFIRQIRLDTHTDEQCEMLTITAINHSLSIGFITILAPIISKLPSFIRIETSDSTTFPLIMFTSIIVQSYFGTTIHFLLEYFELTHYLMKLLQKTRIVINTQTEAYSTFKGN